MAVLWWKVVTAEKVQKQTKLLCWLSNLMRTQATQIPRGYMWTWLLSRGPIRLYLHQPEVASQMKSVYHHASYTPSSLTLLYDLWLKSELTALCTAPGLSKYPLTREGSSVISDLPCDSNWCQTSLVFPQSKCTTEKPYKNTHIMMTWYQLLHVISGITW